ncbi:MAG: hypothetical protein ABSE49_21540 [Polyangiaceae bacterium]
MRTPSALLLLALAAPLAVACEDKKPSTETAHADAAAGADKYASADPKLEKAMKAAASASAEEASGPPPTGIFEAGIADKRHPKGVPTKVDMVSEGSDPKVSLAVGGEGGADAAHASSYGPAVLELAMSLGPRVAMPTVDFGMVMGPGKKDEGGTDWLVASVVKTSPAKQQLAQLPPGLDKDIATLQGSELRVKVTADGRESDVVTALSKGAKAELTRIAQSAAEGLVFATVPLPPKPCGVGGQWISETRMPLSGVDVIAYRAYRVKSIDGDRVSLSLDVKAYAATRDVNMEGVPKGGTFEQFEAQSQGELELVRGESFARKADVQQRVVMIFSGPGGIQPPQQQGQPPGNIMTAQISSQTTLVRGDDLREAMKKP